MAFFEFTIGIGSLINPFIKSAEAVWRLLRGRKGKLSASDIVQLRAKWKPQFTEKIAERTRKKLRSDVIVRDVARLDRYLKIDKAEKGISAWFRVGLVGTYHEGIMLHLGWHALVPSAVGGYRRQGYEGETEHQDDITLALIGYVPYEQIEDVDWDGDEYYYFPVIYCHFDANGKQPYKRLAYCERRTMDHLNGEIEWYSEVQDAELVHRATRNAGVKF